MQKVYKPDEALTILVNAIMKAYKSNCYTMEEAGILNQCINIFKKDENEEIKIEENKKVIEIIDEGNDNDDSEDNEKDENIEKEIIELNE